MSTTKQLATDHAISVVPLHPSPEKCGRNEPCPCGSGKKNKKCCLAKKQSVAPDSLGDLRIPLSRIGDSSNTNEEWVTVAGNLTLKCIAQAWEEPDGRQKVQKIIRNTGAYPIIQVPASRLRDIHRTIVGDAKHVLPERLHHVTLERNAESITRDGLLPRRLRNANSNYSFLPSHPDHVYMTEGNIPFYAVRAELHELRDGKAVVIEVDTSCLDPELLYPDEDYVGWYVGGGGDTEGKIVTKEAILECRDRIHEHKHLWAASLRGYGNVAYRGEISPKHIRCYPIPVENIIHSQQLVFLADILLAAYPLLPERTIEPSRHIVAALAERCSSPALVYSKRPTAASDE